MTEQIEEDFWAAERARDTAARGRQADPGACGTCKTAVAAGGHVKHDECAQRALLLPAPDAPGYELILGLSEEEVHALPARFHIPAFVEPTRSWVCAVCWGDGWSTQWPCKTATEQGLRVFTAEDYAETQAKRQAVELAAYRALELGDLDGRVSASCGNPDHPTWLRAADDERGCPWCRVAELEHKCIGAEPTVAQEMAYLSRCFHAVHDLCDKAEQQAARWEHPLPTPAWVEQVRKAASGEHPAGAARPALPWAHAMPDDDLHDFLGDLVSAAMGRWQSDPEVPDRDVLAAVEKVCANWRTPGQGPRSDEDETGEGR